MQHITTNIETLFKAISILENKNFENEIEYFQNSTIFIESPAGYDKVNGLIIKKTNGIKFNFEKMSFFLKCAQKHILFDETSKEKFACDFKIGDSIQTKNGLIKISSIEVDENELEMFDLEVDNEEHVFYDANGIKHHNTLMTAALCEAHSLAGHQTITVVPSSDLVSQTFEWYKLCGMDVGEYSGSTKDIDHNHVVATWQALQNNPHVLSNINCFVWDEAHGCRADMCQRLMNEHGSHIQFRYGVTGTFPKSELDQLSLYSSIGEILIEIPARWLIDNGYLAEIHIQPVCLQANVDEEFADYPAEIAYLAKNKDRLSFIADLIIANCETYGNTLVLVNSIEFGKKLSALIKDSVFLYGASKKTERKENYDLFENANGLIVIATFGIASTGISINRVFCEVLVDSGKSFIRAIQSVGRGTRLAYDKKQIYVIDIHSNLKWSMKHFRERKSYFKEAQYSVSPPLKFKV